MKHYHLGRQLVLCCRPSPIHSPTCRVANLFTSDNNNILVCVNDDWWWYWNLNRCTLTSPGSTRPEQMNGLSGSGTTTTGGGCGGSSSGFSSVGMSSVERTASIQERISGGGSLSSCGTPSASGGSNFACGSVGTGGITSTGPVSASSGLSSTATAATGSTVGVGGGVGGGCGAAVPGTGSPIRGRGCPTGLPASMIGGAGDSMLRKSRSQGGKKLQKCLSTASYGEESSLTRPQMTPLSHNLLVTRQYCSFGSTTSNLKIFSIVWFTYPFPGGRYLPLVIFVPLDSRSDSLNSSTPFVHKQLKNILIDVYPIDVYFIY